MPRPSSAIVTLRRRGLACAVAALAPGFPAALAGAPDDAGSRVQHRLVTVEPRSLLHDSVMRSSRFTGLDRPLDRAAEAAAADRLSWGRSSVSYYPLDTGLWAGVPSESLAGVRGGIGAGELVDVRFSIGRPSGASGDADVRSMWQGNATGVDHDALSRAVFGGTAGPLEATNLRQLHRATRQDTTVSTAALSRNASLPVSTAQQALPYRAPAPTPLPMRTAPAQAEPAADSMEHPAHRRARLREIAERAMRRASPVTDR